MGGFELLDFKLYYKVTIIKTAGYWQKNRHTDQRNRIESPEISPHAYGQIILIEEPKTYNGGKKASSMNGDGKIGKPHAKE